MRRQGTSKEPTPMTSGASSKSATRRRNGRAGQQSNADGATGGMRIRRISQGLLQCRHKLPGSRITVAARSTGTNTGISKSGGLRSGLTSTSESPRGSEGRREYPVDYRGVRSLCGSTSRI